MFRYIILLILLFPAICWSVCTETGTNEYTCTIDTSISDIQTCVSARSDGDTVKIGAGTATWDTTLTIPTAIKLIGAGKTKTKITSNINDNDMLKIGLIQYAPDIPSAAHVFRLSGFTFDGNDKSDCITLTNSTSTPEHIRIDNNTFKNPGGVLGHRAIDVWGTFYGAIDNNTFTDLTYGTDYDIAIAFQGSGGAKNGKVQWDGLSATLAFGVAENLYVEDNTFSPAHGNTIMHGSGGRSVIRYNTFLAAADGLSALIDAHGNQSAATPSNYSTMITEVYGNAVDLNNQSQGYFVDHRGGRALIFGNNMTNAGLSVWSNKSREEYSDSTIPEINPYTQHVNNSYYFANKKNTTTAVYAIYTDSCSADCDYDIVENTDYWSQRTGTFDGTGGATAGGGVGCGTLAARPATCTTGVAYWATTQSCTDLTAMVGVDPTTPISGTLYKCVSTNSWSVDGDGITYTPYTYPHPLRVQKFTGNIFIGGGGYYN